MKTSRSLRLTTTSATSLTNATAQNGEIFYDHTNKTLRLFDGRTKGGFQLLRADLSNISGSIGANVSDTPPSNPQRGTQWLNSDNGVLYMYFVNENGNGQWIQPITLPAGSLTPTVSLPVATMSSLGAVKVDGESILIDENGVISAVSSASYNNSVFVGVTTTAINASVTNIVTGASGVVEHNVSTDGAIFYHSGVVDNFTANFTNVPTTNNRSTTITLVISQANPAFIASVVQINGVSQAINWANGVVPLGHVSSTDIITFVLVRSNNVWTVLGSLATHGG